MTKKSEYEDKSGHVDSACTPRCDDAVDNCMVCNLFACKVCNCFEGSLPTQCPGTNVEEEHQQLIYKATLDFREGQWVRRPYEKHEKPDTGAEIVVDCVAKRLNEEKEAA